MQCYMILGCNDSVKMTIAIVLTLQEVQLQYYYYCGLPLQKYCDTIV